MLLPWIYMSSVSIALRLAFQVKLYYTSPVPIYRFLRNKFPVKL